jgi:hypothetical protein
VHGGRHHIERSFLAKWNASGIFAAMRNAVLAASAGLVCVLPNAHAYIDPNVGGWLYQLLFPLLIALAGAWAALRHKISEFFATCARRLRGK